MTLVKGGLIPARSSNMAREIGVMSTSELELPRIYWALYSIEIESIVSF